MCLAGAATVDQSLESKREALQFISFDRKDRGAVSYTAEYQVSDSGIYTRRLLEGDDINTGILSVSTFQAESWGAPDLPFPSRESVLWLLFPIILSSCLMPLPLTVVTNIKGLVTDA